ncbi:carbon-nitrogen hydrolase family protein [Pseudooceanicola aestuarii]|uniref:carbon-nitrogen hydrolase family protein n=1 Tax=Pseudooceanicola aestuarii TaxID=2697319 RepID=UPI0013CF42DE|nr:carbon-nitrogen hydrolase family protein [Pseudooceanicola aestuarii]
MKIAAAAYPLDWFSSWREYEEKLTRWVRDGAEQGAALLVFPEYGAMELVSLAGEETAADLVRAAQAVSDLMDDVNSLHRELAARFGVHILGASAPVVTEGRIVNRAHLHTPNGQTGHQDKQIMTLWERDPWGVQGQGPLRVFDTAIGRIAINICYDSEFPLLARAQRQADILLVPSCTDAAEGYWRVRIGAQARAMENQCVAVMSSVIGPFPQVEAVDISTGCGGIYGPPDCGFPADGVIAQGALDRPGWTVGAVDPAAISAVRSGGNVRHRSHWEEGLPHDIAELCTLK